MARAGTAIAPLLGLFDTKFRAGHLGRLHGGRRLEEWARRERNRARPLVWFHASSVGEGLQAESVMEELRRLRPDAQLVYTHFSPSAEPLARRIRADATDYLPYDLPAAANRLLEAVAQSRFVPTSLAINGLGQALFYPDLVGFERDLLVLSACAVLSVVLASLMLARAGRRA